MLVPASGAADFILPTYSLGMCLHLPSGLHYYRACSRTDSWSRDTLSVLGGVQCVQVCGSHQNSVAAKACLQLPSSCPNTTMLFSHCPRVSLGASGLTRASVLVLAATYHACATGSGDCLAPSVRPWPANCHNTPWPPAPPPLPPLPTARRPARTLQP